MWKNGVMMILLVNAMGLSVALYLEKQHSEELASQIPVTKWPEPIQDQKEIVIDGMSWPDPVIRYPSDAVFPKVPDRVAKKIMPDLVNYTNDQFKYTNQLVSQNRWYCQHLETALEMLESGQGLNSSPSFETAIYKRPEYTPFAIDPDLIKDERGLYMLMNETASKLYEVLVELQRGEHQIDNFHKRFKHIGERNVPADTVTEVK